MTDTAGDAAVDLLNKLLEDVDPACKNLDSVELGVTTVDHYFGTLGGISRAVRRAAASRFRFISLTTHQVARVGSVERTGRVGNSNRLLIPSGRVDAEP